MRARPFVLALVAAAPLSLLTSVGVSVHAAPRPVAPQTTSVGFTSVVRASAGTTAGAAGGESTVQTPATAVPGDLAVVGVTWDAVPQAADASARPTVEVRQRHDGTWGAWQGVDVDPPGGGGRGGTEPLAVVGAEQVQARLVSSSGPLEGARLDVVDPGTSPADATAGAPAPGSADAAVTRPTVLTRAQWGADESIRVGTPTYSTVHAAVIHHTAGTNSYTSDQVPAVIRGIYAFHVQGRGWSDVGYNMLVDRFGRTWEGRYGGVDKGVVGAHVAGYNTGSFGISVMGDYTAAAPPQPAQDAVAQAVAWKLSLSGVPADGSTTLGGRTVRTILGHRDIGQTTCPGDAFYARLGAIRTEVARIQAAGAAAPEPDPTPTPTVRAAPIARDLSGDARPDVLVRSSPSLGLVANVPSPVVSGGQVGNGWGGTDVVVGSPDLTGDREPDLIAREARTGVLRLYRGNGRGGFATTLQIGHGWGGMRHLVAPSDWDGDGRADLIGISHTGTMYLYRGVGSGRVAGAGVIGGGWDGMRSVSGVGDVDGDRHADLLAVDGDGTARLYSGDGAGGFLRSRVLGPEWAGLNLVVAVGDWDGDGRPDVVGRSSDGRMRTWFGDGAGGFEPSTTWGAGWSGMRTVIGPGDWDGDGRADLLGLHAATGSLLLYSGTGARDFASATPLASPPGGLQDVVVVGDLDGNRRADVVARNPLGELFVALTGAGGEVGTWRRVGWGWAGMDLVTAAGDLSGDAVPDLLARQRATGDLLLYTLDDRGSVTGQQQVGARWGGIDLLVGVGPWDGDAITDVLARRAYDGALMLYPGAGQGRFGTVRQVGSGWGAMSDVVGIGDYDRDGHQDLLARPTHGTDLVYRGDGAGGFLGSRPVLGIPSGVRLS